MAQLLSPRVAATEAQVPGAHALQPKKPGWKETKENKVATHRN